MLVLPDYGKPYIIDSLTAPVVIKHNWIFNAPACDFMLSPITYLEETTGAVVKVRINNSEFWVPATWNILVTDRETYQLDTVAIQSCASTKHIAFSFSPDEMKLRTLDVMVVDYAEDMALVHPMISKGTALVHPVGPTVHGIGKQLQLSVVIGPHDLYKHLQNKVIGDVFSF
jgi:hypothetical protein